MLKQLFLQLLSLQMQLRHILLQLVITKFRQMVRLLLLVQRPYFRLILSLCPYQNQSKYHLHLGTQMARKEHPYIQLIPRQRLVCMLFHHHDGLRHLHDHDLLLYLSLMLLGLLQKELP